MAVARGSDRPEVQEGVQRWAGSLEQLKPMIGFIQD